MKRLMEGEGRRRRTRPDLEAGVGTAHLPPHQEDRERGGRQRHMNKAMLLHFNQLLPSHMAAEHPEGRRRHES